MKERKELSVGTNEAEAIASFSDYDPARHECLRCSVTGLWQVFRRRVAVDRGIGKPVTRETRGDFRHYRRKIVVSLMPGDVLKFRLKGCKSSVVVPIEKVYAAALQWQAFAEMNAKRIERAAKRKARRRAA
jgi:hypothetical protein